MEPIDSSTQKKIFNFAAHPQLREYYENSMVHAAILLKFWELFTMYKANSNQNINTNNRILQQNFIKLQMNGLVDARKSVRYYLSDTRLDIPGGLLHEI